MSIASSIIDTLNTFAAYIASSTKQTMESYCDIQTADSPTVLVMSDGSLASIIEVKGVNELIGQQEFKYIHDRLLQTFSPTLSNTGYTVQVHYTYNKDRITSLITDNFEPSIQTAKTLQLDVADLINERIKHLSSYCAEELLHIVLITKPSSLSKEEQRQSTKLKTAEIKDDKIPPFQYTQNVIAACTEIRNAHDSFARGVTSDLESVGITSSLLDVHTAINHIRRTVDLDFTDKNWQPVLVGDKFRPKIANSFRGELSDLLWPSLPHQIFPRDARNLDLKTCLIGDRIYASVFIDLYPKNIQPFENLLGRTLQTYNPWRISFLIDGNGMDTLGIKRALASVLSFSSAQNRLINNAVKLLDYIKLNTDDAVVRLRVTATTWANSGDMAQLRTQTAQLARAIQSWGSCDVSEICGDAFEGTVSSMLGVSMDSPAASTVGSLSDILYMLPMFRPTSPWDVGSFLLRTPDGKPWPYQPGSPLQTTWIDLIYARPGSGKSVLSNAINLSLCLQGGIKRLPRISVIDIGPSSSGLISLIQEALPPDQRYLAAYHRLQMTEEYSINPFDTHLGCRKPFPQERSFLVNFVTLLATPVGIDTPYDGIADMAGIVIDESYKSLSDNENPNQYTAGIERNIDKKLKDIGFKTDSKTTWWEVTDALFNAGCVLEASIAQRNAVPLLNDLASIARSPSIVDLYGKITVPTGENLIDCFTRMISASVREYPILSRYTQFDIGNAKVVSLDLDEVAKSGGDAANRQTAVMYMLARYVLAKDFYINLDVISSLNDHYKSFHAKRVAEIRDDQKRIVMDEFHRTAKAQSVRDQVIVDMREGRKWKVQICLISQSLDDFSSQMIDFATSSFIMDSGPEQAIQETTRVFGLSETAQNALRKNVHGPRSFGSTFLALIATKSKTHTQLLTATLGPIELWALSTTADDVQVRTALYHSIGPKEARRVLANVFPSGSAMQYISDKLDEVKQGGTIIDSSIETSVIGDLIKKILANYKEDANFKSLA